MQTKLYLDCRYAKDKPAPLKLVFSKNGETALLSLGIYLSPEQWLNNEVTNHHLAQRLNLHIARIKIEVDTILLDLEDKGELVGKRAIDIKNIVQKKLNKEDDEKEKLLIIPYMKEFMKNKSLSTQKIYHGTLTKIERFKGINVTFDEIDKNWLVEFDNFVAQTSPAINARNIHLRNIRAVFNDAIDSELVKHYPFRKFKIRNTATRKRSLPIDKLRQIMLGDVKEWQVKHRDIFTLSFLLIGINPIDLYHLTEINNGRIEYIRSKTKTFYSIKVEPEAMELIQKYKGEKYLLNYADRHKTHELFAKVVNRKLKSIDNISLYWARHSWATIAASLDIPNETIAKALGHSERTVTDVYINFDHRKIDEANRKVIDFVFYGL